MIRERAASNQDGQNPGEHRKRRSIHIQIVVRDELRDSIDDVRPDELHLAAACKVLINVHY